MMGLCETIKALRFATSKRTTEIQSPGHQSIPFGRCQESRLLYKEILQPLALCHLKLPLQVRDGYGYRLPNVLIK